MLALMLTLAIAQPVSTNNCAPGRNCRARTFTAQSGSVGNIAVQIPNLDFLYFGASCGLRTNGSNVSVSNTCNFSFGNGQQGLAGGGLYFSNVANMTTATAPSVLVGAATLFGETATGRLYQSNGARWTHVGGGQHPVTQSPSYVYVMDRGAGSNAPAWAFAPRSGAASVAFTSAGTLTSGTTSYSEPYASYATTAVSGNQAHHSAAVCVGPSTRWSARVGFGALASFTNTRAFFGLSATLPLTSGSSTPTADAAVFRADTTVGANWYACTSDGTGALSCTDTGVAVGFATDVSNTLEIDCREPDSIGVPTACTFWINGRPYVRRTSSLPNAAVGSTASVETLTAATRAFYLGTAVSLEPSLRVTP